MVRFAFEQEDDVACSSDVAVVIVDDATEQARLVESLYMDDARWMASLLRKEESCQSLDEASALEAD